MITAAFHPVVFAPYTCAKAGGTRSAATSTDTGISTAVSIRSPPETCTRPNRGISTSSERVLRLYRKVYNSARLSVLLLLIRATVGADLDKNSTPDCLNKARVFFGEIRKVKTFPESPKNTRT